MKLTFYKTNANGKLLGKFYEINKKKDNSVYIHYGAIPMDSFPLPIGKIEQYKFSNKDDANKFYEQKVNEKLKKKYKLQKGTGETNIFKWMLKNTTPTIKNKTMKKKRTDNKTRKNK